MLEFKNVSVALSHGEASKPFSMIMSKGESACLCAPSGSGKTALLKAIMGMSPVVSGYITIDGELVGPGSADYFRRIMAYIPQHLPDVQMKVSELCQCVFNIRANRDVAPTKEAMWPVWQELKIDKALYAMPVDQVGQEQMQLILLSMLPLLKRPIILIDNLLQTQLVYRLLQNLKAEGAEILYTCEDNVMPCDKLVKL
ncbi:MAG: ATP-binding cassette domain-containing protein [Prevotella sp.]|jgi:ABC-type cobalamin/Fe3+-siderophores transport system ATPase subunit